MSAPTWTPDELGALDHGLSEEDLALRGVTRDFLTEHARPHLGRWYVDGALRPQQVSLGKLNNVRSALAIARECRSVLGANGISADYSPLRHAANLESVLTYEGTTEMHTLVVGQALTGLAAFRA